MLHAQFLAAREEAADMRARYRCGSPDICSTQSLTSTACSQLFSRVSVFDTHSLQSAFSPC